MLFLVWLSAKVACHQLKMSYPSLVNPKAAACGSFSRWGLRACRMCAVWSLSLTPQAPPLPFPSPILTERICLRPDSWDGIPWHHCPTSHFVWASGSDGNICDAPWQWWEGRKGEGGHVKAKFVAEARRWGGLPCLLLSKGQKEEAVISIVYTLRMPCWTWETNHLMFIHFMLTDDL